jgi:hypothetical protein
MISSNYIYSDIDLACQWPILYLILTIINIEREWFKREAVIATNTNTSYIKDIPVICYYSNSYLVLMNNWQNTNYFTSSFLILFPLGTRGHILAP